MVNVIFEINDRIKRNDGDKWRNGQFGTVVELSEKRARVKWDKFPARTWIKKTSLIKVLEA